MIIGVYAALQFGNQQQLQDWLAAHDYAHTLYQIGSSQGEASDLQGPVNEDWFGRHLREHQRLLDTVGILETPSLAIDVSGWRGDNDFHWWHFYHNRMHSQIDSFFGL